MNTGVVDIPFSFDHAVGDAISAPKVRFEPHRSRAFAVCEAGDLMDSLDRIDRRLRYLARRRDQAIEAFDADKADEYGREIDAELERRATARTGAG